MTSPDRYRDELVTFPFACLSAVIGTFYQLSLVFPRANDQDRTGDLILTMDALYQLSYIGFFFLN
jgi:hypothetical protein